MSSTGAIANSDALVSEDLVPVWDHVRSEADQGRQTYVVCPLIEESDKLDAVPQRKRDKI